MAESNAVLRLLQQKSELTRISGTYVGRDEEGRALVDFSGGRVPAYTVGAYRPEVNETVWVDIVDGVAFLLGPTKDKPGTGTIDANPSGGVVAVSTDIGDVEATYPSGAALSIGQEVQLLWDDGGAHVLHVRSTSPASNVANPNPSGGGGTVLEQVFTAIDAGSFHDDNGNWWQSQVWSSDNNLGAWFYGSKIADTIPSWASIEAVAIYLSVVQKFGDPPNWAVHANPTRPGGAPSFAAAFPIAYGGTGWLSLSPTVGDVLKSGGGYYGIGVVHGGFHKFSSLGADPLSGALAIRYRS